MFDNNKKTMKYDNEIKKKEHKHKRFETITKKNKEK